MAETAQIKMKARVIPELPWRAMHGNDRYLERWNRANRRACDAIGSK